MKRFILSVVCVLAATVSSTSAALTPPIGWTAVGSDMAVLDPEHPEKGQVLEFRLDRAKGMPEEVVAALMKKGVAIERFGIEPNGHINLVGPEHLGRAKLYWAEPSVAMCCSHCSPHRPAFSGAKLRSWVPVRMGPPGAKSTT